MRFPLHNAADMNPLGTEGAVNTCPGRTSSRSANVSRSICESTDSTDNNFISLSLDEQRIAEEGRLLLDPFHNLTALESHYNNEDVSSYHFFSARPRTASEPIANPLPENEEYPVVESRPQALSSQREYEAACRPIPLSQPRALSRRRGVGASSLSSSIRAPSISSLSNASSASSSVRVGQHNPNNVGSTYSSHDRIEEETEREGNVVRASLDSGMSAVRSWIRSRSFLASQDNRRNDDNNIWQAESPSQWREGDDLARNISQEEEVQTISPSHELLTQSLPQQQRQRDRSTSLQQVIPSTAEEQEQHQGLIGYPRRPRQRALSEPDAAVRDLLFQRALTPHRGFRRLRYLGRGSTSEVSSQTNRSFWGQRMNDSGASMQASQPLSSVLAPPGSSQLSSTAVEVLYAASTENELGDSSTIAPSDPEDRYGNIQSSNSVDNNSVVDADPDPQREARARWILINRRFQVMITIVALIFSLLLFGILVCWVVLTSAYVVSIERSCDVPLRAYFWFATFQLILDVFRSDIMRCIFRWDANSNQRIPCRVITYNAAYLVYAFLVLRMGIRSVFLIQDTTCKTTAPELFQSSTAFVSLSIAAWGTIILGYLFPFLIVATLLTLNGYTPGSDSRLEGAAGPVFPTPMGAPPGCIDQLRKVRPECLASDSAKECCICMEQFSAREVIVETECNHRYHRHCLADWLRQARTCPVCRMDVVPNSDGDNEAMNGTGSSDDVGLEEQTNPPSHHQNRMGLVPATRTFGRNTDIHHEVVSLFQIIRRSEIRNRQSTELRNRSGSIEIRNRTMSQHEM